MRRLRRAGRPPTPKASLADTCWNQKVKHDDDFKEAFTGVRNHKDNFRDKVLSEQTSNKATLTSLGDLTNRAATVFAPSPSKESPLGVPAYTNLEACETNPILTKVVVGSADVAIADLIKKLGNGDWVNAGQKYLSHADGKCPFSQQSLPDDLEAQLTSFFNQAYTTNCKSVTDLLDECERGGETLKTVIKALVDGGSVRLDLALLRAHGDAIGAIISENVERLNRKKREPSVKVELKPIGHVCAAVKLMIDTANTTIATSTLTARKSIAVLARSLEWKPRT
ncbi:hypothetical protein BH10PLA1_BH10PLA1_06480 [soil metagenome]